MQLLLVFLSHVEELLIGYGILRQAILRQWQANHLPCKVNTLQHMCINNTKKMEEKSTYKLICPSSSCRAKSRSEREPKGWCFCSISVSCSWGLEEDGGKAFWRFFLIPFSDLFRAPIRLHNWGWWCFIIWSILWTLAWTEWLGLVDWMKHKMSKSIASKE